MASHEEGAEELKDTGNHQGGLHRNSLRSDGSTKRVGHVVRAYYEHASTGLPIPNAQKNETIVEKMGIHL